MNTIKTIINISLILILLQLPCSAVEPKDDQYISFALESFFNIRGSNTDNQIYSPLGVNSCVSALTHMLHGQEKIALETAMKNGGINNKQLFFSDDDEASLQLFTTILTRNNVTNEEKAKIQQSKIILGENILAIDNNPQQQAKRDEFRQKIQNILQQKFKGKQQLSYEQLWSEEPNLLMYLKIISALRFEAKWLDGNFKKIGKHNFTSFDNQQLTVDYMKNNITGDISYSGINTNRWKSVRIFYENNYALDIIIPQEETKYTNTDKIKMITSLIKSSNNSSCNQDINLTMPLFTFKKKTDITSMLKEMLPNFNKQDIKMEQECIIEVDEEGTKAEAITSMFMSFGSLPDIKDITINNGFYYILSELEKIRSGFHTSYNLKNIIMIGAVNNPLVEN